MRRLPQWAPVAIWTLVILASSNDHFSADSSRSWLQLLFGEQPAFVNVLFRKTVHLVAYGIHGALAWVALRRNVPALLLTGCVAAIDEWCQAMTANRTGTAGDVLLDLAGAVLALVVVIPMLRKRHSAKREEQRS
jgi:VanZ family protein